MCTEEKYEAMVTSHNQGNPNQLKGKRKLKSLWESEVMHLVLLYFAFKQLH